MPVTEVTEHRTTASSPAQSQSRSAAWVLFAVLIAASCGWILSLPVFPSQDGAVHVYYARVTRDLLAGHSTYSQDFRVARPFPPYSLHAYVLMALLSWTSSEMAEKLLACISVVVCGIGLAYFARQIGRSAPIACALAVPFLLNRYLFLGFYGYQIGIGLALLAAGLWLRHDRATASRLIAFLVSVVLTIFAHPVPYLILIAFCWSAAAAGWHNDRSGASIDGLRTPTRRELLALAIATALFLYIKHYSHSGMLWNNELLADTHDKLFRIVNVFRTWLELPLMVPLYNGVLGGALLLVTLAACWRARTESLTGKITRTQLAVGWAILILIALPFLPRTMNGSGFFADRFSIWPPLLLFAAVSSWRFGRKARWIAAGAAIVLVVVALVVLNSYLRPVARELDVAAVPAGSMRGLHVYTRDDGWVPRQYNFVPYEWAAVRVVDRAGAILVDSPWMDLQIMMLEETGPTVTLKNDDGARVVSGPPVKLGAVFAHCGVNDTDGRGERITAKHPDEWQLSRYSCFQVLRPVP